jgi:Mg/Co/Ni transporter MgtE
MCYESLLNGDATDRSLGALLRAETGSALTNGGVAAAVVLAVLLVGDSGPLLAAGSAVAALALGYLLHQTVLLAGVALVRWRVGRSRTATASA